MFDALRLLDQFVGAGTAERLNQLTGGRMADLTQNLPGGLGGLAEQAQGMLPQGTEGLLAQGQAALGGFGQQAQDLVTRAQEAYGQHGVQGLVEQGHGFLQQHGTGFAAGAALAGLGALLAGSRGGRAVAGGALRLGGLALVGGLAYKAFQNWQAGQAPAADGAVSPAPAGTGFATPAADDAQERATTTLRMMIAAAKADGHIDTEERARILGRLDADGIDAEEHAFLQAELAAPLDLDGLVATATTVERAIELYTAAVVAIDPDTAEEQGFLNELATRLGLNDDLRHHLDAEARGIRMGA